MHWSHLKTVNVRDLVEALSYPGLWRFAFRHRHIVVREFAQSFDQSRFVAALQRLVPEIQAGDLVPGGPGVRAQAVTRSGEFVHLIWPRGRWRCSPAR